MWLTLINYKQETGNLNNVCKNCVAMWLLIQGCSDICGLLVSIGWAGERDVGTHIFAFVIPELCII
jgi:hypothetical protein